MYKHNILNRNTNPRTMQQPKKRAVYTGGSAPVLKNFEDLHIGDPPRVPDRKINVKETTIKRNKKEIKPLQFKF